MAEGYVRQALDDDKGDVCGRGDPALLSLLVVLG